MTVGVDPTNDEVGNYRRNGAREVHKRAPTFVWPDRKGPSMWGVVASRMP